MWVKASSTLNDEPALNEVIVATFSAICSFEHCNVQDGCGRGTRKLLAGELLKTRFLKCEISRATPATSTIITLVQIQMHISKGKRSMHH